MASKLICKHCGRRYTRSTKRMFGRTFCSIACFWRGQKVSVDEAYRRDNGVCWLCHKWVPRAEASRDHVIPRTFGGRTEFGNIRLAHRDCNSRRGHRDPKEYTAWWEGVLEERERNTRHARN